MMCAANRPCAHESMPLTWSCQNTVPESTSEYQRYWTNSTVTGSPALCVLVSAASRVSWLPVIAVIFRISMFGRPTPMPIEIPTRSLVTLDTVILVAGVDRGQRAVLPWRV